MLEVPIYNIEGQDVGKMAIDEELLGGKIRAPLLKQAVVMYQANLRQGTAATKSRGMVRGSTRKLYRQKGTGNARMGMNRTPVRRGGGHTFAKSARDFGKRMPKRMRRLACRNAVLVKILSNDAIIFDNLNIDQAKTKQLRAAFHSVGATRGCVLALDSQNPAMVKSGRNIPKTDVRQVGDLNAYDILRRNKLIFTKPAFESFTRKVQSEGGD